MSRGFAGIWLLLILWFSLVLCIYSFRQKNYGRFFMTVPVVGISYYLVQFVCGEDDLKASAGWIFAVCIVCTLIILIGIINAYRWQRTHLSVMSVKYAVDELPTGICCYDAQGRVLLKNRIMEELHRELVGKALLNGVSFEKLIFGSAESKQTASDIRFLEAGEEIVVLFPNRKVYEFSKNVLTSREFVLTASEITEEYRKTQTLLEKQQTVTELNKRLRAYNKEILSVITAREVLNAKVKIHDELGASLLRVKKYLENTDLKDEREKRAILELLRQNVTFLQREVTPGEEDEYSLLLKTAKQLDVRIEIEGMLPTEERYRNICVTALHECLTNTLRHAQGNLLCVSFRETEEWLQAAYTNNGKAPSGDIVEKGGLKSLRRLVEQEGGKMEIRTDGGFRLSIIFEKGESGYGV